MNLLNFRDRIRAKAIEVGLSYSEIEGLTDVNELLNQDMPCLMFNYEQETNDFSTPSTVLTPRIYLITTIFDAELTETGEYQRDWIITKKNELREKYIDWIKIMQLDGSSYIEVLNDTQLQLQQRVSIEGFLIMEALPQFKVSREFCLLTEDGGITPPSCAPATYNITRDGEAFANGEIQSGGNLNLDVPSECAPCQPATITLNGNSFISVNSGDSENVTLIDEDGAQVQPVSIDGSEITLPTGGGYVRNPDWITMPTVTEDDNVLYGLFIVFENEYNELNIQGNNINQCLIDWGNGSTPILTDGSVQSNVYDFNSTLPNNTIYQWEDGRNYKQVMVTVTPQDTSTGQLYFNQASGINNGGNVNFVDIICAFKDNGIRLNLSGINQSKRARLLKIFKCLNTGNSILFYDNNAFGNLDVEIFETQNGDLIGNLLTFNGATLRGEFRDLNGNNNSAFQNFRTNNPIRNITNTAISGFRLAKIPSCQDVNVNGVDAMWDADIDILGDVTITATNFRRLFQGCTTRRLNVISMPSTPVGVSSNGGAFSGMVNLQEMVLPGFQIGFDISNSNMLAPALNDLFTSLGTANGNQTIIVTGNPGASTCDTTIATNKGFTVITA